MKNKLTTAAAYSMLVCTALFNISKVEARDFGKGFGTGAALGALGGFIAGQTTGHKHHDTVIVEEYHESPRYRKAYRDTLTENSCLLNRIDQLRQQIESLEEELETAYSIIEKLRGENKLLKKKLATFID